MSTPVYNLSCCLEDILHSDNPHAAKRAELFISMMAALDSSTIGLLRSSYGYRLLDGTDGLTKEYREKKFDKTFDAIVNGEGT